MVAVNMAKTEDGKISCVNPEGIVININIKQRSCLDSLLDTIKTLRTVKKDGQDNTPNTTTQLTHSREPLVEGVLLIVLGCFNVMLGVIFAVVKPSLDINDFSAQYWIGFPFIISGVLNIVAYKKPKVFWVVIVFICLLSCLAETIAGLVFLQRDVNNMWWRNDMTPLCDEVRPSSPYYKDYYEATLKFERCKGGFQKYQDMLFGLVVMSSVIMAAGLSICLIALHYSIRVLFIAWKCEESEKEKDDPLLSPDTTQDIIV